MNQFLQSTCDRSRSPLIGGSVENGLSVLHRAFGSVHATYSLEDENRRFFWVSTALADKGDRFFDSLSSSSS